MMKAWKRQKWDREAMRGHLYIPRKGRATLVEALVLLENGKGKGREGLDLTWQMAIQIKEKRTR
jgi:hypothetical protein